MVDQTGVEQRLARLDQELARLTAIRDRDKAAYLADDGLQRQAERALQVAIQICIDVGAHLVAAHGLGPPDDYRDVFERLTRGGGLDRGLAERMKDAVGQRNLLVHAYLDIDPERIWRKLGEADDLRAFARWALDASRAR